MRMVTARTPPPDFHSYPTSIICNIYDWFDLKFHACNNVTFALFLATAPQQEAEAESTVDLPNKSLGQSSCGPNPHRDTAVSAPPDKDCDLEKSTDNVAVTLS